MYANELLDAYKKAQNYVQDKQIAHDLNLEPNKISKMRKGIRYITDEEAIFLAQGANIEPEIAILGCHADRNENPNIKQLWMNIAEKYDGMGFSRKSMSYSALAAGIISFSEPIRQCALYVLC
ncbi:MAG: DUF3693 domain-containing protein [Vibrio sp.]